MQQLLSRLLPFLIAGVAIVAMTFGVILLAYLFVFGAIVGVVLFALNWVRDNFFGKPKKPTKTETKNKSQGRIIDSNDWRKL